MQPERYASELVALQERVSDLHDDVRAVEAALAREHFEVTEDARARLVECRQNLRWAGQDLERAREALPPSEAHSVRVAP